MEEQGREKEALKGGVGPSLTPSVPLLWAHFRVLSYSSFQISEMQPNGQVFGSGLDVPRESRKM